MIKSKKMQFVKKNVTYQEFDLFDEEHQADENEDHQVQVECQHHTDCLASVQLKHKWIN